MKSQSLALVFSFLVAFLFRDASAAVNGGRKGALAGGWSPIKDPKDPEVIKIGEFAVNEHNKQSKRSLKFDTVVKGETQVVSGMNYRLVVSAQDGSVSNDYLAVVLVKPWEHYESLLSFKRVLK